MVRCRGSTSYLKNIPVVSKDYRGLTWHFLAHLAGSWMALLGDSILVCLDHTSPKVIGDVQCRDDRQKVLKSIQV